MGQTATALEKQLEVTTAGLDNSLQAEEECDGDTEGTTLT